MKLKCDLTFTQAAGREIAVPADTNSVSSDNILFVNGVASFILKSLKNDISKAELLARLIARYDAKKDEIEEAMEVFLRELDRLGLIKIQDDESNVHGESLDRK